MVKTLLLPMNKQYMSYLTSMPSPLIGGRFTLKQLIEKKPLSRIKIEITLPHDLKSTNGYTFPYNSFMRGEARICLSKRSILQQILNIN